MFKSIVPGLEGSKTGTAFLINDIIMPELGTVPRHLELELRQVDMVMVVLGQNSAPEPTSTRGRSKISDP
ncbi:hypothetical protein AJ80_00742 [Polytolypa hystricis UAMH7299]|uniref:Uncharacterized protein n=1 Tax=Polytolypa hystricis (strain UAMH7299) TaxID=1447883 RepID=A0A2B7Z2D1_POLH7|nr:hypothetical protein AJ80_00742 [Polytolypa hystricis UAMH7299]